MPRLVTPGATSPAVPRLYVSQVLGSPIRDASGKRLGRIRDLVVRFGDEDHPAVTGIVARQEDRDFFLPIAQLTGLSRQGAQLATLKLNLTPFARRDGEALLRRDILDKQLIDVTGRRVVRANDLVLARVGGKERLVGVDVSVQGLLRRLGPSVLTGDIEGRRVIDWKEVESFATDVPMVRLRVSHGGVAKLHPVTIAHLLDGLPQARRLEIVAALDDETAADTVQEMDPEQAALLMQGLDEERAADILDEMDPDDAADVLADLSEKEAEGLLERMEPEEAEDVRNLLEYEEDTAAGLMTTDYVVLPLDLTAGDALASLRRLAEPPNPLYHVYLVDADGSQHFRGVVPLRDLVLAWPATPLRDLALAEYQFAHPDEAAVEVAHKMAEYNLAQLPVLNEDQEILGAVFVDDAMDVLLPDLWQRRRISYLFR